MFAHSEAHAGECTVPNPTCHLENGKDLLESDPKRAAEELLASYKLDERTDTLALYATALQADKRYALALETWQRIIVFRDSEVDAAKADTKSSSSKKRKAARTALTRAQKGQEQAAEAIIKLWNNVGKVRVQVASGQQFAVTRGGIDVDISRDVFVNAGKDELVFTRKDGSSQRVVVEVAAGQSKKIDPPAEQIAKAPPPKAAPPKAPPKAAPEQVAKAPPPKAPKAAPEKPLKVEQPKPAEPVVAEPARPAKPAEPARPMPDLTKVRVVEEPRSRTMSRVGLGLVAGAVVAGGIAGTLGYLSDRDYDRSKELGCSPDGQCPFGPAADMAQRSNDRARWAQISGIAGGAMLATGMTLFIVGRGKTQRTATDVTLRLAPSSAAIAWRF